MSNHGKNKAECSKCKAVEEKRFIFDGFCTSCYEENQREMYENEERELNSRHEVFLLDECQSLDDLKGWIKEHLLKGK